MKVQQYILTSVWSNTDVQEDEWIPNGFHVLDVVIDHSNLFTFNHLKRVFFCIQFNRSSKTTIETVRTQTTITTTNFAAYDQALRDYLSITIYQTEHTSHDWRVDRIDFANISQPVDHRTLLCKYRNITTVKTTIIIPRSRVLSKLTVPWLVEKFTAMWGLLPRSRSQPLVLILSQNNPVHTLPFYFLVNNFNIIFPSTSSKWPLSLKFLHQNPTWVLPSPLCVLLVLLPHSSGSEQPPNI